jgi:hypothetical protein
MINWKRLAIIVWIVSVLWGMSFKYDWFSKAHAGDEVTVNELILRELRTVNENLRDIRGLLDKIADNTRK